MDIASIGKKTVRVNVRKIQDCDEIDVGPDCTLTCFLFCADLLKTLQVFSRSQFSYLYNRDKNIDIVKVLLYQMR